MKEFPTVPKEKARELTKNWRKYYAEIYNGPNTNTVIDHDGSKIFRGFRIPLEDLSQILETVENYNAEKDNEHKINSVRAYIAKNSEDINRTDDIHVLLVPIVGGKNIVPPISQGEVGEFGNDLLEHTDRKTGKSNPTIYNFTTPCPTECDTRSELYSESKKSE